MVKKTDDEIYLEFAGESHTLLNLLRTELLADERVKIATYDNKFPIMANPIFRLKTSNVDPIVALREAASRIAGQCQEFSQQFAEATK